MTPLKPSVSIILVTYNRAERFLPKAIESVLAQTLSDYELIVVDDGSVDSTKDLVQEYQARFPDQVRYVYQDHQGMATALNEGFKQARSEWIAYIDSDDLWMPTKLEKQIRYLRKTGASLVHVGRKVVYLTEDRSEDLMPMPKNLACSSEEFLSGRTFISNTMVVRKEALRAIGMFDPDFVVTPDTEFWLKFARRYEIHLIREPLVVIQKHDSNAATSDMERKYKERIKIYERTLRDCHPMIDKSVWRRRLTLMKYGLAQEKFKKQSFSESRTLLKEVICEDPFIGIELVGEQEGLASMLTKIWTPYEMLITSS